MRERVKYTKRQVAAILRKVANNYESGVWTWIQGLWKLDRDRDGIFECFCVEGALREFVPGDPTPTSKYYPTGQSFHPEGAFQHIAGEVSDWRWNDSLSQTAEKVIRALRKRARELEHGK